MSWKSQGIIYCSALPHCIYSLSLSNPYPPPCYRISDACTYISHTTCVACDSCMRADQLVFAEMVDAPKEEAHTEHRLHRWQQCKEERVHA